MRPSGAVNPRDGVYNRPMWIDSESATIRPEGVLSEVYAPEATREELAAAVGQVLDILSDDEEEDE